jgi:uncharacterized protein (TIGR02597 family)
MAIQSPYRLLGASALALLLSPFTSAQSVATTPVGAMTINVNAGTGTARVLTVISMPLTDEASITGASVGRIGSLTANSITVDSAGWTAGALSTASVPYQIQITSGTATGRTFLISTTTANTSTSVVLDSEEAGLIDLTTLGIVTGSSGDTFKIMPCDTLATLFGTPATTGILGATSSAGADTVQISISGAWRQYYFNTTSNGWLRIGPNTPSNNVPIRKDAGILYSRLASTPLSLVLTGTVPFTDRRPLVRNSGLTVISQGWPVDVTLSSMNLQNIPGWSSNSSSSTADIVQIQVSGAWRQYYHNGTQWLRVGPNTPSNTQSIPASSAVLITRKGSATGSGTVAQSIPYTL